MQIQVTLDLPTETYERAINLAQLTSRDLEEVLTDALVLSLPSVQPLQSETSIQRLTDDEVIQLAQSQMDRREGSRFHRLQDKQQRGLLNDDERIELARLLQIYQAGLLRKALAFKRLCDEAYSHLWRLNFPVMNQSIRKRIRHQAGDRCGYCRSHQRYVWGPLEIEHIQPKAHGGTDDEENLWLACSMCNTYKAAQIDANNNVEGRRVPLFNPRQQRWSEHFCWNEAGDQILGLTACSRATVTALQLNNLIAVTVRRAWIGAGWHPPVEDEVTG